MQPRKQFAGGQRYHISGLLKAGWEKAELPQDKHVVLFSQCQITLAASATFNLMQFDRRFQVNKARNILHCLEGETGNEDRTDRLRD